MIWNVSDPVDIRANSGQAWSSGVVATVCTDCYIVTLDTPITANVWTGTTRPLKGSELLTSITVLKHCDSLVPNEHIRTAV